METQLVRLDKPYNIICGNNGHIALHIATLIVITEFQQRNEKGNVIGTVPQTKCYPVVSENLSMEGDVWIGSELKECHVICKEKNIVGLYSLKSLMEFCAKSDVTFYTEKMPHFFSMAMMQYDCPIVLPKDNNDKIISSFEINLLFEENNDGNTCMVYADKNSDFYFYEYFTNDPVLFNYIPTNLKAVQHMAELRDAYLQILRFEGLRSITFTTKDENYKWFVEQLNAYKVD